MAECGTVKAERTLIVACGLIVLAWAGTTLGDGGMFFRRSPYNQQADIFQPTQKVYIRWDGSQESLLIQTKYEGPAEEMVWMVPVPLRPTGMPPLTGGWPWPVLSQGLMTYSQAVCGRRAPVCEIGFQNAVIGFWQRGVCQQFTEPRDGSVAPTI